MKSTAAIKDLFSAKLRRNIRALPLSAGNAESFTAISLPLSASAADFGSDFKKLKSWIASVQEYVSSIEGAELEFKSCNWKSFGFRIDIPSKITLHTVEAWFKASSSLPCAYATFLKATVILKALPDPYAACLKEVLASDFYLLSSEDAAGEVERLCALIAWLDRNHRAHCFVREIPVRGIDSKWFEKHRALTAAFFTKYYGEEVKASSIFERWQFNTMPVLFNLRHAHIFAEGIAATEYVKLPGSVLNRRRPKALVIIENNATGMSVEIPDDTAIIFGLGRDTASLKEIAWIKEVPVFYMGDLDCHGLIIVSELRRTVPQAVTVMTDLSVLKKWRDLCVPDPTGDVKKEHLEDLTAQEQALYTELLSGKLRLEQERIDIKVINEAFARSMQKPKRTHPQG